MGLLKKVPQNACGSGICNFHSSAGHRSGCGAARKGGSGGRCGVDGGWRRGFRPYFESQRVKKVKTTGTYEV
jgi:hypothetical protein